MKVLLKAGANVNQTETAEGASPLYIASQEGNVDIVKVVSTSPVDGLKDMKWYNRYDEYLASDEGQAAKKTLPFCRLWCIVELTAAIILNVPIVVKGTISSNTCL